jgi:hypothetical protein
LLDLGFEALASERVVNARVVTVGLSEAAADAGDDLRDTAFVEVVNVGDFLVSEVFEDDFFEDGEIASAVLGVAGRGRA